MNKQITKIKRKAKIQSIKPESRRAPGADRDLSVVAQLRLQHKEETDMLVEDKKLLMLQVTELRNLLSTTHYQLKEQSSESKAASELLRLHLSQLQDDLRALRLEQQKQTREFTHEKDLLVQQIGQLQEQLEHYFVKHKHATLSIETLSTFVEKSPRLQLLNRVNRASGE